jgi:aminoglycoside 3-N-acetyltransferase I
MTLRIDRLGPADIGCMRALNALFAAAFDDPDQYLATPPPDGWLEDLLADPHVIVLVAALDGELAGGLTAYRLRKFEQARSEIYLYDLAVAAGWRRQGIATALIARLGEIAVDVGAYVVFVQADLEDEPAIRLYAGLGTRQEVLHFDIVPRRTLPPGPTEGTM